MHAQDVSCSEQDWNHANAGEADSFRTSHNGKARSVTWVDFRPKGSLHGVGSLGGKGDVHADPSVNYSCTITALLFIKIGDHRLLVWIAGHQATPPGTLHESDVLRDLSQTFNKQHQSIKSRYTLYVCCHCLCHSGRTHSCTNYQYVIHCVSKKTGPL